jgi:hypothetical protein
LLAPTVDALQALERLPDGVDVAGITLDLRVVGIPTDERTLDRLVRGAEGVA